MTKLLLLILVIVYIFLRVVRRPEQLALYALILSSTLPVITQGELLALGRRGFTIRVEFVLIFIGLSLVITRRQSIIPKHLSIVITPALLMFLLHVVTIPVSLFFGTGFGFSNVIRLLETFIFFFILVQLTDRKQISKLVHSFISVGAVVSLILLITSLTANHALYNFIFNAPSEYSQFHYSYVYMGKVLPRIWLNSGDEFLPLAGVMVFLLFLLKEKHKFFYGIIALLYFVRIIASGQRSFSLIIIFGYLMVFFYLSRISYLQNKIPNFVVVVSIFILILYALYANVPELQERLGILTERTLNVPTELSGERQNMGMMLAVNALNSKGLSAWMVGLGGFLYSEMGWQGYDINTPILGIYRFGVIGLLICFFWITRVFQLARYLLKNMKMSPEELAVVLGVIIYIVTSLIGTFFRGFVFSENFPMLAGFIILTSWMEVIYRDTQVPKSVTETS